MTVTESGRTATTAVRTVCSYCGVGCGMVLDVATDAEGRRTVVRAAGDKEHPANFGRLCTKGATTADMLAAPGRLGTALVRAARGSVPAPSPVDAAIAETARRLREIIDEHGPDAVAFYVSGQMTLEAQYLVNKLAKGFVRTNQIESNSRLCMASAGTGYKLSLGADGPPGSYQDFEHADLFLVIGANMADCHPILYLRMMDRVKAGARLIVVDPRRTPTAAKADLYLPIRPGTDLALLNGLLHLLVEDGRVDEEFIAEFTEGWEAMPAFLADYTPARVAEITGLPEDDIRRAARMIGEAGEWMSCWTMGLNQSTHGTWNTNALCNLHLATGAICRPGSGPFSLTGQPNAMGGREMGYMGPGLPGQRSVLVEEDRRFTEELWGLPPGTLRTDVGKGTVEMFSRMADGEIKACWIICTNPVASVGNRKTVIAGLEAAEFVITQDAFADTETNSYADLVLPAALWAEGEGVMINSERSLTLLNPAADPPGEALPDWQIIARVACAMGYADAFTYESAEEVFEEIKRTWNPKTGYDLRGVTYDRLRDTPVQWPSASAGDTGRNPVRYLNDGTSQHLAVRPDGTRPRLVFPTASGRAAFFPRPHMPPAELPDDDFPFVLNTGRLQHQWHTLTKTGKVAKLNKLNPGPFVEIHPGDAASLGIAGGDLVQLTSRRGRAVLPAVVTDRVRPGDCFAPFHWNDLFGEYLSVNAVTNDAVDPLSFQPELKACAVALAKVATPAADLPGPAAGEAPEDIWQGLSPGEALARLIGVDTAPPPFDDRERGYLSGFLAGLGAAPPDVAGVPVLPSGAPFAPGHALWVDGALAGMFSRTPHAGTATLAPPAEREDRRLIVLWASQTGNAENFAAMAARALAETERAPVLLSMADCTPAALPGGADLLVITSTFGDGDAPDNGADFWHRLADPEAPRLEQVRFSVLAFGDTSYADFCGHGRRLDKRLEDLGAVRLAPRVDCEPGDDGNARQWLEQVIQALATGPSTAGTAVPGQAAPVPGTASPVPAPPALVATGDPPRDACVTAILTGNRLLSLPGATKEVRQFTFDLGADPLPYEVGDALGVWPVNPPDLVAEWLAVTGLSPATDVAVADEILPLGEALRRRLDISKITIDLLRFLADRAQDDRLLRKLLRPDNRNEFAQWTWGRQAVDVAAEFPVRASAQEWADTLKALQPRRYSISSSPLTSPREVQITVSVVRFDNPQGRRRSGVCSGHLADVPPGTVMPVFVRRSPHFRPPADPATPMVMVGPGTGVAPFLGFLDERRARGHQARNWLFFGEQRRATDFYYREELEAFRADGVLTRLDLAFSRDQRAKVYVQDRMREQGARLWSWLQDGAHVYVCGDATRMAKDVDRALREIAHLHGGLSTEAADAYVRKLATDRRYARDVY
ncbi:bifunctional nitrate reductase/sulfite reductase flavoprotein subunit alpha [Sphaerisporangium sp. B11E5]|uniref:bifunctional nitrate reductase/sulfite reductase flavoprotein subunit alpha n=1 Tax=Sphaerisporangium sp. B11E5 TaxID=3153563 RepID=UPI00325D8D56